MGNYNLNFIKEFDNMIDKNKRYSIIIPVYKNYHSLPILIRNLEKLNKTLKENLEVVFVIDGSPDESYNYLEKQLPEASFTSKLILLSRNFGAFSAIQAGFSNASGHFFAVMAADLQDPMETILEFFILLESKNYDIIIGTRSARNDPLLSKLLSNLYWWFYRKYIQPELPRGGVDFYGFNRSFRDKLISLNEANSSFIGLIFWLGFRRKFIKYDRMKRPFGKSSWNLSMKIKYFLNSVYAFSELPIKIIQMIGLIGVLFSFFSGFFVLLAKVFGQINVPGYTATVIFIIFFGSLNILALAIIAGYIYRTYENTKARPKYVVINSTDFNKGS